MTMETYAHVLVWSAALAAPSWFVGLGVWAIARKVRA